MNNTSLRFLTWGTALAALAGAVLLSGGEAGLPELVSRAHFEQPQPLRVHPSRVFNAPAAARGNSSAVADTH